MDEKTPRSHAAQPKGDVPDSPSSSSTDTLQEIAVASLVIGVFSALFCAGAGIGAITGIVLGTVALTRAIRKPEQYSGKKFAIGGIIVNVLSLVVTLPLYGAFFLGTSRSKQVSHETSAISITRSINKAEWTYQGGAGHGRFGDLMQLAAEHLIDPALASGQAGEYRFTCTPLNIPGGPPMYDSTAKPIRTIVWDSGTRSFGSNETAIIYEADGIVDLKGTPTNRQPSGGVPIQ